MSALASVSESPWKLTAALLVAAAIILAALFLAASPGTATRSQRPTGVVNFPPFEMVRVQRSGGHEAVFHLRWESHERWKETLIGTNRPVPAFVKEDPAVFLNLGSYQQAIDGKLIHFDLVRPCLTCPVGRTWEQQLVSDDEILVPGIWFAESGSLLRTYKLAEASETETEITVRIKTPVDTEEWVFDKRTGIPVRYRKLALDGTVSVESHATSVVLLSGEVIR